MEKFLLLIREDLEIREKLTPEEFDQNIRIMTKWVESLAQSRTLLEANALVKAGRYVGRSYIISDGPFIEAKEAISGYVLINAENLEQATSVAQTCPLLLNGVVVIEVRPILTIRNEQSN